MGQLEEARKQAAEAHDLLDDLGIPRQDLSEIGGLEGPRWLTLKERIAMLTKPQDDPKGLPDA